MTIANGRGGFFRYVRRVVVLAEHFHVTTPAAKMPMPYSVSPH